MDKMPSYIGFFAFDILTEIQNNMTRTTNENGAISFGVFVANSESLSRRWPQHRLQQASDSMKACVSGSVFVQNPLEANFAGVLKHTQVRRTTMHSKWAIWFKTSAPEPGQGKTPPWWIISQSLDKLTSLCCCYVFGEEESWDLESHSRAIHLVRCATLIAAYRDINLF